MVPALKRLRIARGLSQGRLATMAGLEHYRISAYERGNATPIVGVALRIAAAMSLSCEVVWALDPDGLPENLPSGRPRASASRPDVSGTAGGSHERP